MTSDSTSPGGDFTGFVESQSAALLRLAYVLTGQREAAEYLVQDALVAVFRHWRRVATAEHRVAYVRRILVNRYLSTARRRHWEERPLDASLADPRSDSRAAAIENHDLLWRALGGLSPRQQAALVLRFYEDLDDQQIGVILRCRPATVRSLTSRALASLRASAHLQIRDGADTRTEEG